MCASRSEEKVTGDAEKYLVWLDEMTIADIPKVGGKNASLGEMLRELASKGVSVPYGFCTTADAYRHFIHENHLEKKLRDILSDLDIHDVSNLAERGKQARRLILNSKMPPKLEAAIISKYEQLCQKCGQTDDKYSSGRFQYDVDVAVRSSATAEDLPDASFAGQQETYLNVHGSDQVVQSVVRCFASLFTDRAISYRTLKGFDHFAVALSCGVQKMVRSDLASAGVIFTINTENGFQNVVLVTGSYGLGEMVVQGTVNPDEYIVFKPTLARGFKPILEKRLGSKEIKMIYSEGGNKLTKNVDVSAADRARFCLEDDEILQLARWACIIEDHYTRVHGKFTPMDIEWAKCGKTGNLYIVQARPETVQSRKQQNVLKSYKLLERGPIKTKGKSVGEMIGAGRASVIKNVHDINLFKEGDVLVTNRTDPDWEPIMKKAKAIVTNQGGRTCHAAIIARELGIPAVVGCSDATEKIAPGDEVTVSCAEGDVGRVYAGILDFKIEETALENLPKTKTKIMMNVGNPTEAMGLSFIPNGGVGLARLEFIIANHIKTHPLALLHFDELESKEDQEEIAKLTQGYRDKAKYFVDKLASGIAMIAAAFFPNDVIVRLSDLKTNEYANLLGGSQFEPKEENPMIGWRGASRYYDPKYSDAFALECQALLKVREAMGLTNVIPMIPFCRTPQEGRKVLAVMAENGLRRGENGLQVYVMCEIPSNVILAKDFAEVFDGFSIGSNDLTQLTLGLDRDSALVAHIFDERNEAVKTMIRSVIRSCKETKSKIGICGQAPSDYPEFAAFLVECGIDSISLNPDSVLKTILHIASLEERLGASRN
eukprot:TRINITY_DN1687_c0_g1_i1.p1 TRINITY_DN1687_c0_g1~~TRINITY_DN1687_c0_g1_i1.p1  ORF type:complete len:828 (-),score=261.44 TRINITY_DN1687_c0_g1_i1:73-2556(-)